MRETHRGAWLIWSVALVAYLLAVFHRSSLAVAGLYAMDRFDISASQLATFVMLQLFVYAGMQIPVGLFIDRFGPRRIIVLGTIFLAFGQVGFALSDSYALALGARVLVGIGDAMTFTCVLRLITSWFSTKRIPLLTQLTGPTGQLGSIIATIPMTWALAGLGWERAYLLAAAVSLVMAVVVIVVIRDAPGRRSVSGAALSWLNVRSSLGDSWAEPGTRLGFWTHFTTQFSTTTLGLLWGFPYFVRAENTSDEFAGVLLTIMVVAVMIAGPGLGWFVGAHPYHRSTLVMSIIVAIVAVWTAVLLWPGDAPGWLLVALVIVAGVGGPASMIGFDYVRTSNPPERLGAATGIVNQGGFVASLILIVAIGIILDLATPGTSETYGPRAFHLAMSFQYVLWSLGLWQIWRYRRRSRAAYPRSVPLG